MKEDFLSSKNTYAVNPDDLDIAFQGYRMYEGKEREAPFFCVASEVLHASGFRLVT